MLGRQSALADVVCHLARVDFVPNGITYTEGRTTAGQPCQMVFGMLGADIEALRTVVRPSHGILGASGKEGNKRFMAYVPKSSFVGLDRFEVDVRYRPLGRAPLTSRLKVQMNVTP